MSWNGAFRGAINFYGHVHGRIPGNRCQIDVGVDMCGFALVRLNTIIARLQTFPENSPPDAEDNEDEE